MIDQQQYEQLRTWFSMSAWTDIVRPALENRARQKIKTLVLFPSERREEDRDDAALRASIAELEWFLNAWSNEMKAFEHNRAVDELAAQQEQQDFAPANP